MTINFFLFSNAAFIFFTFSHLLNFTFSHLLYSSFSHLLYSTFYIFCILYFHIFCILHFDIFTFWYFDIFCILELLYFHFSPSEFPSQFVSVPLELCPLSRISIFSSSRYRHQFLRRRKIIYNWTPQGKPPKILCPWTDFWCLLRCEFHHHTRDTIEYNVLNGGGGST